MVKVKKFVFSPFSVNTYLVWDKASKEAAVIDPGCSTEKEKERLSQFVYSKGLTVKYLWNTHCHIDHILGNKFVKDTFYPVFIAPEKDLPLLRNLKSQGEMFGMETEPSPEPDYTFENAGELLLGETHVETIFTPGHTPGEYSFYFAEDGIVFTGDVLFRESIGRTDLWGGDITTLLNSIRENLFALPEETVVFPGHLESTTIAHEKANNPFVR